jgi:FtsH-binding integral membrane protein
MTTLPQAQALRAEAPPVEERARLLARIYLHLFGALVGFTLLEVALFASGLALPLANFLLGATWIGVLGGFVLVGWIARRVARRTRTLTGQYLSLAAYVVAEAILFSPLLIVTQLLAPGVIRSAAMVALLGFTALTLLAFTARTDFSPLRSVLAWGGMVAVLLIVAGASFGFQLGTYFSVGMVALAGLAILYETSSVLRACSEDRCVAAALELFASVALMLWYVLRLLPFVRR